ALFQRQEKSHQQLLFLIRDLHVTEVLEELLPLALMLPEALKDQSALSKQEKATVTLAVSILQDFANGGLRAHIRPSKDFDITPIVQCASPRSKDTNAYECLHLLLILSAYISNIHDEVTSAIPNDIPSELRGSLTRILERAKELQSSTASTLYPQYAPILPKFECPKYPSATLETFNDSINGLRQASLQSSLDGVKEFVTDWYFSDVRMNERSHGRPFIPQSFTLATADDESTSVLSCQKMCRYFVVQPGPKPKPFSMESARNSYPALHVYDMVFERGRWKVNDRVEWSVQRRSDLSSQERRSRFEHELMNYLCTLPETPKVAPVPEFEAYGMLSVRGAVSREIRINGTEQIPSMGGLSEFIRKRHPEFPQQLAPHSFQGNFPIGGGLKEGVNSMRVQLIRRAVEQGRKLDIELTLYRLREENFPNGKKVLRQSIISGEDRWYDKGRPYYFEFQVGPVVRVPKGSSAPKGSIDR
ncbi:MAG: hypothetical protein KDD60_09670, partial [Bdellovibrionales bacterium]|nr:hypothetical protein [Bdellovibrionales bacterium]